MDPQADWITLEGENIDPSYYRISEFFQMSYEFRSIELNHMLVAVAKYGGPIAITKNSNHIMIARDDNLTQQNICFYANNGEMICLTPQKDTEKIAGMKQYNVNLLKSISLHNLDGDTLLIIDNIYFQSNLNNIYQNIILFHPKQNIQGVDLLLYKLKLNLILGFEFIEDELLLVVYQDGRYLLIDPSNGVKKQFELNSSFQQNKIVKAKVFDNGFVFSTQDDSFYYVQNTHDPYVCKFCDTGVYAIKNEFFIPISPKNSNSGMVELLIAHPKSGIVLLQEQESKKYLLSNDSDTRGILEHIPKIKMISISANNQFIAYFTEQGENFQVHILSFDFSPELYFNTDLDVKKVPDNMVWCSDDCVVLTYSQSIVLVGPAVFQQIQLESKGVYAYPEIDGVKLVTNDKCQILRKLPDSFIRLFQILSYAPSNQLYEAYKSFENRKPLSDEDIRNDKENLVEAVLDCIDAGTFVINSELQNSLLLAASYGKAFLKPDQIDQDLLCNSCKLLRVVHSLKDLNARTITFKQIQYLKDKKKEEIFLKILLRYKAHFLADQICKVLYFSQSLINRVYIDWAVCKIESFETTDENIFSLIKDKFQGLQNISFTDIAHKAIQIGKNDLAVKLLGNHIISLIFF